MDRIARVIPGNNKTQALLAHVRPDEHALICYCPASPKMRRHSMGSSVDIDCGMEVMLRIPLCLALAADVGNATISIKVASPAPGLRERLQSVDGNGCEVLSALRGQRDGSKQGWALECQSQEEANLLLRNLQLAGCSLEDLHHRYRLMGATGKGRFGLLFRAEDRRTGEQVAVKVFLDDGGDERLMHPLLEAHILRKYGHPNIQEFRGLFQVSDPKILAKLGVHRGGVAYAMVTEFLAGGELFTHVKRFGQVSEDRTRRMMRQLLSAAQRLHKDSIVHRDIKLENLILTGSGDEVKLIDFGLSASEKDAQAMGMKAGSVGYLAPEVLLEPASCKADCFSSGVVMFTLLTGKTLFPGNNPKDVLQRNVLCNVKPDALVGVSEGAKEVVLGLLRKCPRERFSAKQALQHPWFTEPPAAAPTAGLAPKPSTEPDMVSGRTARQPPQPEALLLQALGAATGAPSTLPCASGASAVRALQSSSPLATDVLPTLSAEDAPGQLSRRSGRPPSGPGPDGQLRPGCRGPPSVHGARRIVPAADRGTTAAASAVACA